MNIFKRRNEFSMFYKLANLIRGKRNVEAQMLLQKTAYCQLVNKSGTTLLHVASEAYNKVMTHYLLDKQLIHIDVQDSDGKTPLMLTLAERSYEELARILLDFKPNIHIRDNFGKTALQMVFEIELTRIEFIEQFVNIVKMENQNDSESIAFKLINIGCPLHHAIIFKNSEITRIMLENGCPINAEDFETGKTALHVAVHLKDLENVRLLVESGADVDALDLLDRIPFFYHSYDNSKEELEILKILVERGTSLTTVNNFGRFPIYAVSQQGNREALLVLLNSNINLDARDAQQVTPVLYYLSNDKVFLEDAHVIVESLRSKNFDVNATNVLGSCLLSWAAATGVCEMVQLLLDRGAETNITNYLNVSPLHLASKRHQEQNYRKCIELLLEHGADPQIITAIGDTVFDDIVNRGNYFAVEAICGQLAILDDRGVQVSNIIRNKIEAHEPLKNQFESCKKQLEELKTTVVHKSMTLYEVLSENQKKIAFHARDDDFFFGLTKFNNNYSSSSYYCHLLQSHLEKPIKYATTRRKTIDILCDVMGFSYNSNHIVIDKITGYVVDEIWSKIK